MFWRVVVAEMRKNVKQFFFSRGTLFWALILPLGNGLYLYFLYFPFVTESVNLEFNASAYTLDLVGFTLIGQLLYSFLIMIMLAGAVFDLERQQGTLEALLLSPANRLAILLGGALARAITYIWMLIAVLFSWVSFLQVTIVITDFLALLLSITLSYLSLVALGMCLEAFFIHSRRGTMYGTMIQEPLMFFSGMIFPLQAMPKGLLIFSYLLPLTFGLIAVRLTLLGGASLFDVTTPLAILAAMVVVLFVVATWLIGYAERTAKAQATLTQF